MCTKRKYKHVEWMQEGRRDSFRGGGYLTTQVSIEKMAFELQLNQMRTSAEGEWRTGQSKEIRKGRTCVWTVGNGLFDA